VKVYAGIDPISGKRRYLTEVVPAGKNAAREAEKIRTRFQGQVDEQRSPRTNATVTQLMDRYLELLQVEDTTRAGYESLYRLHIKPLLGRMSVGKVDGETLDSLYAELRRCRTHCDGRAIDHRTPRAHECDKRCSAHQCRPMSASSIRQIHNLLNGAFSRAVKWRWVGVNPVQQAEPPPIPRADPQPPTPAQAAAIVTRAWNEPNWGMLVWLAMTTGARRGELCALRWRNIDFETGVLDISRSIGQLDTRIWEKDTKTHQRRRIVLDQQTLALLRAYLDHRTHQASLLEVAPANGAFVFSPDPDGAAPIKPDTVTQRYRRMCAQLGWQMHIHQLRHFSATELIAAGVDVRTVAGRLGHSGGGSTTLRVYSAWVSEADQRAATSLVARLPTVADQGWTSSGEAPSLPPGELPADPAPYQRIAEDLRSAIRCGALKSGDLLPTVKHLSARYEVSAGTANRVFSALREDGLITVARGRRAVVA
jgi:integrase